MSVEAQPACVAVFAPAWSALESFDEMTPFGSNEVEQANRQFGRGAVV
jgi:hypothetical protein